MASVLLESATRVVEMDPVVPTAIEEVSVAVTRLGLDEYTSWKAMADPAILDPMAERMLSASELASWTPAVCRTGTMPLRARPVTLSAFDANPYESCSVIPVASFLAHALITTPCSPVPKLSEILVVPNACAGRKSSSGTTPPPGTSAAMIWVMAAPEVSIPTNPLTLLPAATPLARFTLAASVTVVSANFEEVPDTCTSKFLLPSELKLSVQSPEQMPASTSDWVQGRSLVIMLGMKSLVGTRNDDATASVGIETDPSMLHVNGAIQTKKAHDEKEKRKK
jgi:hypothetical protein